MATLLAHASETPLPPSSVSQVAIPEPLEALVLECLAKKPTDRPPSAAELSRRLDAAVAADSWDQEQAAQWWQRHQPARQQALSSPSQDAPVKVTKVLQ